MSVRTLLKVLLPSWILLIGLAFFNAPVTGHRGEPLTVHGLDRGDSGARAHPRRGRRARAGAHETPDRENVAPLEGAALIKTSPIAARNQVKKRHEQGRADDRPEIGKLWPPSGA